jgi:hypothetical protein
MPWGFQEVEAPRFQYNWHMKVVRLSTQCTSHLYPQEIFLVLISVRGWVDSRAIVLPEGLCQWKIPMTPLGIWPMPFQLIVQCLNQLPHRRPHWVSGDYKDVTGKVEVVSVHATRAHARSRGSAPLIVNHNAQPRCAVSFMLQYPLNRFWRAPGLVWSLWREKSLCIIGNLTMISWSSSQ